MIYLVVIVLAGWLIVGAAVDWLRPKLPDETAHDRQRMLRALDRMGERREP